jgi:hypothetical protein
MVLKYQYIEEYKMKGNIVKPYHSVSKPIFLIFGLWGSYNIILSQVVLTAHFYHIPPLEYTLLQLDYQLSSTLFARI